MTYEDQSSIEVLVVLLSTVCVMLNRLPLVHRVDISLFNWQGGRGTE